jgi:hypothetical protein
MQVESNVTTPAELAAARAWIDIGRERERLRPWDTDPQTNRRMNDALSALEWMTRPVVVSVLLAQERAASPTSPPSGG